VFQDLSFVSTASISVTSPAGQAIFKQMPMKAPARASVEVAAFRRPASGSVFSRTAARDAVAAGCRTESLPNLRRRSSSRVAFFATTSFEIHLRGRARRVQGRTTSARALGGRGLSGSCAPARTQHGAGHRDLEIRRRQDRDRGGLARGVRGSTRAEARAPGPSAPTMYNDGPRAGHELRLLPAHGRWRFRER